jgi:hypothetical protein
MDEARKAVNAAFDAMSIWRIETANTSESSPKATRSPRHKSFSSAYTQILTVKMQAAELQFRARYRTRRSRTLR